MAPLANIEHMELMIGLAAAFRSAFAAARRSMFSWRQCE